MNVSKSSVILLVILTILIGSLGAQNFIQIGNGTTSTPMPIYSIWNYGWSKSIYDCSTFGGPKTISQLGLNQLNNSTLLLTNQKVWMKQTTATNINGNLGYETPESNGYTLVYDGPFQSANGLNLVDITDFNYTGTGNLMILWENRHGTESYSGPQFAGTDIPVGTALIACLGADNGIPAGNGWEPYPRALPNMRFYYLSNAPGNPDNPSPANNAFNIQPETQLNWTFGSNTATYDLLFGTSQNNLTTVVNNASVAGLTGTYQPQNLQFNTQYFWKIIARGSDQSTTEGPVWSFTTRMLISQFPYQQDFEGHPHNLPPYELSQWMPEGWQKSDNNWDLRVGFGIESDTSACMAVSYTHTQPSYLFSPRFNITPGYRVKFQWTDRSAFRINDHDTTYFEVSSNGGTSWTTLEALTTTSENDNWMLSQHILNGINSNNVFFRWRDVTDGSLYASGTRIDAFTVEAVPMDGEILIRPTALNFPATAVGNSVTLPITIKNLSGNLNITGIQVTSPFSAAYQGVLAQGDSVVVPVTFQPTTAGNFTQTLAVQINGNYQGQNTIQITGSSSTALTSFLETFDAAVVPALPTGWTKLRTANNQFTDITTSANSSDSHSPANFVKMLNFDDEIGSTLILVSPQTTGFEVNQLTFWAKTQWPNARMQVGTLTNPVDASTFVPVQMIYPTADYAQYTISFTNITDIRNIGFKKICGDSLSSIYMDDVSWQNGNQQNPPLPSDVVAPLNNAVNVAQSPLLRWTIAAGLPTAYKLFVGTDNPPTNMVNGQDLGNVQQYQISSVIPYATPVYWKVIPYNQYGDAVNCPVWQFTIMNDPSVTAFPWLENFDTMPGMIQPLGWTVLNLNNDTATWKTISNLNQPGIAYSQPTALHCPFSFSTPQNDWIFTPPMTMNANTTYRLSFYYHIMTSPEGVELPEKMEVKWGNAASPDAMNIEPLFQDENILNLDYQQAVQPFTTNNAGQYYIGFHSYSDPMMWLLILDNIKVEEVNAVNDVSAERPVVLQQNYPNPFNPSTTISFSLFNQQNVTLKIYNSKGQVVKTLVNGNTAKGTHNVVWNGKDDNGKTVASGLYFYKLKTQQGTYNHKMLLIK